MVPGVQAQTCSGNGDVVGAYGFAASRMFAAVPVTAPGTNGSGNTGSGNTGSGNIGSGNTGTGNTGTGNNGTGTSTNVNVSNTDFGRFLGGVSGQAPFGTVGRIVADGSGNLFATASATTGSPVQVGTYTVNSDCTMSATFTDTFVTMPATAPGTSSSGNTGTGNNGTGNTGTGGTSGTMTPVSATFEGVVLNHGNDIELVQTGSQATGAVVEMRRTLQFSGCTNASLTGAFGVVSQASEVTTTGDGNGTGNNGNGNNGNGNNGNGNNGNGNGNNTGTPTAVPLFGRLVSNGNGTFGIDALGQKSALPGRQLTGTYTVNSDCTGTAQVVTSNGVTRNLNFVIVRSDAGVCQSGGSVQPELLFGFTDAGVSGIGFSR